MQTTTWILDFPKYTVETLLSVGKYCAILNIHGISLFSRAAIIIRDIFLPLRATGAFNLLEYDFRKINAAFLDARK